MPKTCLVAITSFIRGRHKIIQGRQEVGETPQLGHRDVTGMLVGLTSRPVEGMLGRKCGVIVFHRMNCI